MTIAGKSKWQRKQAMGDHDRLIEAASTKSICESDYMEFWGEKLSNGPALHYVSQTLFWLVT